MLVFSKKKWREAMLQKSASCGKKEEGEKQVALDEAHGWPDHCDGVETERVRVVILAGGVHITYLVKGKDENVYLVHADWCEERPDLPDIETLVNKIGKEARS